MMKQIAIRLPDDLIAELQRLADLDQRSLSDYCRIALKAKCETKRSPHNGKGEPCQTKK